MSLKREILAVVILIAFCLFWSDVPAQKSLKLAPLNPAYTAFLDSMKQESDLQAAPPPVVPDYTWYWKQKKNKAPGDYPIAFDLRSAGPGGTSLVTPVKHQLSCGACWAFATYGSIESTWLMAGYGENDLSENNLKNCHGFTLDPCQWGHHFMSTAYLVRGDGPIYESDDPYQPENDTCLGPFTPAAYIPESRYLPEDPDAFKETIMNTGAVYNTYKSVPALYTWINGHMTYCYQGPATTSHAIAIVGWNDTLTTSCGQGAWLVKDQYGTGWGEGGFWWIGYQDTLVLKYNSVWPYRELWDPDLKIYQYDTVGGWPFAGYEDSIAYGLIKFTAEADQMLTHIGTYTTSFANKLDVAVYSSFDGNSLSGYRGGRNGWYAGYPGFHRIKLEGPVRIHQGEDFYIQVRWSAPDNPYPMACEGFDDGYTDPVIETGKCWSRAEGGPWEAWGLGTGWEYDQCIKAFAHPLLRVDVKLFPEGAWTGTGLSESLLSQGLLPEQQPFNGSPWNYNGTESLPAGVSGITDWVLLEIRNSAAGAGSATADSVVAQKACLLKSDGTVIDPVSLVQPDFDLVPDSNLYLVVKMRNHLPVISSVSLTCQTGGLAIYDFTSSVDAAWGSGDALKETGGVCLLYAGDADGDGIVGESDYNPAWKSAAGLHGYYGADLNLDGEVNNIDKDRFWYPNRGKTSQMPQ
ncbi:MAG: hypothetical protein Kow00127_07000 [Bacteroidales bacterium]